MGIEPITSVLQTDASPSRPQTVLVLWPPHQHLVKALQGTLLLRLKGTAALLDFTNYRKMVSVLGRSIRPPPPAKSSARGSVVISSPARDFKRSGTQRIGEPVRGRQCLKLGSVEANSAIIGQPLQYLFYGTGCHSFAGDLQCNAFQGYTRSKSRLKVMGIDLSH